MHKLFKYKAYEQEYGLHFNQEEAAKCRRILNQLKDTPTISKEEPVTTTDIIKVS